LVHILVGLKYSWLVMFGLNSYWLRKMFGPNLLG
jgi:hypothetical protein